ncbi:NAD-dependent glycerol-3-phosphate dehydrogenase C-terminus-domain-containing protein [Lentinula raphanica]|nr:NAD-dependent glycerol-3-phosphate dehydrogenase C-terminus-domain-containing protein [Lentinula raphanica]
MAPYVTEFDLYEPQSADDRELPIQKIAVVGSGSWGTALARIAALNAAEKKGFDHEVRMWVREREIPGQGLLTEVINSTHMNHRYLPDVPLPHNLVAVPELVNVVKNATLIVLVVPHQFLTPVLEELSKPGVLAPGARAISAIKGVEVAGDQIYTFPWLIEQKLGIPCSALGGANIAMEVAQSEFCETTIGVPSKDDAALWHAVFDSPMFRVHPIEDVSGVSLSGALKNVVALAAGFVDGMGYGGNTKAAILRIGLLEMAAFTKEFFPSSSSLTFSHHSAGVADLITTSFGGRNRKCAEAFIKTGKTFAQLEHELLKGQKLQGVATAEETYHFLHARGRTEGYPLFTKVYKISFEGMDPKSLFDDL